jgi:hypothetical protein
MMPSIDADTVAHAPVEEVWKLLYDPTRFPDWWDGVETVVPQSADRYTMYPTGYPDFPMPQELTGDQDTGSVRISCLVSDLVFAWTLRPAASDDGAENQSTSIAVHVSLPEAEKHRLAAQTAVVQRSLANLVELVELVEPADGSGL